MSTNEIKDLGTDEQRALLLKQFTLQMRKAKRTPLSFSQERIWSITQMNPENLSFNLSNASYIGGDLDAGILEKSLNEIVNRHEILRSVFRLENGKPVQVALPVFTFRLKMIDGFAVAADKPALEQMIGEERKQPFDLGQGLPFRAVLLKLAPQKHLLILMMHQIVFDAESWPIIIRELGNIYQAFKQGSKPALPKLVMQYADYASWQRERFQGESYTLLEQYWRERFTESMAPLQLPVDRLLATQRDTQAYTHQFRIEQELLGKLKEFSQQEKVSLFITLLTTFNSLLYMYTMQEHFLIFTSVSSKNRPELKALIGLFSNLVPLQVRIMENQNLKQLLESVYREVNEAVAHQDLPFDKIMEAIKLKQTEPRNIYTSLFQVMFTFRYEDSFDLNLGDIRLEPLEMAAEKELDFQIHLWMIEKNDHIECALTYNATAFTANTIQQIVGHYRALLESYSNSVNQPLCEPAVFQSIRRHSEQLAGNRANMPQAIPITPYEAPRDETETKLAALWQDILGIEKVGIHDNFFELGGHSLNATKLLASIHKEFNVAVSLTNLFDHPTLHLLSDSIKSSAPKSVYMEITPFGKKEYYPVSYAQKRMYILNQLEKESASYNISNAIIMDGPINVLKLEEAIQKLVKRHDSLRTRFDTVHGELVQIINDNVDFSMAFIQSNENELDLKIAEQIKPFDLTKAPLFRIALIKINDRKHALVFDMHHIISDGTSMNILIMEFVSLYNNRELPDSKVKYVDYVGWQKEFYHSPTIQKEAAYWLNQFQGEIPRLDLPTDFPYSTIEDNQGDSVTIIIESDLYARLKNLALKTNTTLYMVLLAALYAFFWKITGQEDIIFGTPVTGRSHPDLQNIVGFFLNTLVIRNYPKPNQSYLALLEVVRNSVLNAYDNQNYQFEDLIETLDIKLNQNPLFNVWVNLPLFQNKPYLKALSNELAIEFFDLKISYTKSDLLYFITEEDDSLQIKCIYKTKLFKKATAEYFQKELKSLLEQIAGNPDSTLKDYRIFTVNHDSIAGMHCDKRDYFNGTINQSITQRFEDVVKRYEGKIAVESPKRRYTYEQINKTANQTARNILAVYNDQYKLTKSEKIRYTRQLLLDGWGVAEQEKLKSTTVFVAGAGGSGSPLIMQLALCGFGTIIVADFDTITLSNLNRQVLHSESRIGMNKALSAKMTVKEINPNVKIIPITARITRENVFKLVNNAAIIMDNVDDLETKFILSECAVAKGIPHIISSMIDISSYVAVFHSPKTPCFHCLYDVNKLYEIKEMLSLAKNYQKLANPVSAPALFASTGFACNEAIKVVLGFESQAYNKYFFFNQKGSARISQTDGYKIITYPFSEHFKKISKIQGFDWNIGYNGKLLVELKIEKNPDCPLCGKNRLVSMQQESTQECKSEVYSISTELDRLGDHGEDLHMESGTIALFFNHDVNMIIGIIGALKTGKAYIPLDPSYPEERLKYILEDTGARVIVTDNQSIQGAKNLRDKTNKNIQIVNLDQLPENGSAENLNLNISPNDLAYILYTSGSTGQPKGVMQNHRNVLHFVSSYTNQLHINDRDKLTLLATYSFDAAVVDIFTALLNGATVFPLNIKEEGNINQLTEWLKQESITIYHSTPTLYRYWMNRLNGDERFSDIRLVVMGGEAVYKKDFENYQKYFSDQTRFVNGLSSTESSVTLLRLFDKNTDITRNNVSVGYPVSETESYILAEDSRIAGVYEIGEVIFKSEYLALGYWNQEAKTAEVFIKDPVSGTGRVYRSGDLGRYLPDGSIEHIGRKDFQVKIRGYRIETGEIESKLDKLMEIEKSIVHPVRVNQEYLLAAYYKLNEGQDIAEASLRQILADQLPEYMIPNFFIRLDKLPLTRTGKIDRKSLPAPSMEALNHQKYIKPQNEWEAKLAEIWREVLKVEKIGIHDNFFDLGGHSLIAMLMIDGLRREFTVEVPLRQIFQTPTIAGLAEYLTKEMQVEAAPVLEESAAPAKYPRKDAKSIDAPLPAAAQPEVELLSAVPKGDYHPFYNLKDFQLFEIEEAERKVLHVKLQNEITTYLCHALPLCVVLADDRLLPWYYEHFINLFSVIDENGYLKLEFLEYRAAYKEVMYEVYLGYQFLKNEANIICFLIDKINAGYYVIINVDEYYLPVKAKYQKQHFVHHSLVYGYDNSAQKLLAIGFDANQLFTKMTFDYKIFMTAYEAGKQYYQESAPWAENNAVELLKLKAYPQEYPFVLQKFLTQLDNYLAATGDDAIAFTFMMDQQNIKYGVRIYEEVITRLEDLLQGRIAIDYRAIHLLSEHKKVLYARLQYIMDKYALSGALAQTVTDYYQIVEQVEWLRKEFLQLNYNAAIDAAELQNVVRRAVTAIQTIKENEQRILADVSRWLHAVIAG